MKNTSSRSSVSFCEKIDSFNAATMERYQDVIEAFKIDDSIDFFSKISYFLTYSQKNAIKFKDLVVTMVFPLFDSIFEFITTIPANNISYEEINDLLCFIGRVADDISLKELFIYSAEKTSIYFRDEYHPISYILTMFMMQRALLFPANRDPKRFEEGMNAVLSALNHVCESCKYNNTMDIDDDNTDFTNKNDVMWTFEGILALCIGLLQGSDRWQMIGNGYEIACAPLRPDKRVNHVTLREYERRALIGGISAALNGLIKNTKSEAILCKASERAARFMHSTCLCVDVILSRPLMLREGLLYDLTLNRCKDKSDSDSDSDSEENEDDCDEEKSSIGIMKQLACIPDNILKRISNNNIYWEPSAADGVSWDELVYTISSAPNGPWPLSGIALMILACLKEDAHATVRLPNVLGSPFLYSRLLPLTLAVLRNADLAYKEGIDLAVILASRIPHPIMDKIPSLTFLLFSTNGLNKLIKMKRNFSRDAIIAIARSRDTMALLQALGSAIVGAPDADRRRKGYRALRMLLLGMEGRQRLLVLKRLVRDCPFPQLQSLLIDIVKDSVLLSWKFYQRDSEVLTSDDTSHVQPMLIEIELESRSAINWSNIDTDVGMEIEGSVDIDIDGSILSWKGPLFAFPKVLEWFAVPNLHRISEHDISTADGGNLDESVDVADAAASLIRAYALFITTAVNDLKNRYYDNNNNILPPPPPTSVLPKDDSGLPLPPPPPPLSHIENDNYSNNNDDYNKVTLELKNWKTLGTSLRKMKPILETCRNKITESNKNNLPSYSLFISNIEISIKSVDSLPV